jgi:signal transduction histidine kinase
MNAILGMADLLSEGPLGVEQRRYVDTMRSNGNALLHLINEILDVVDRLESLLFTGLFHYGSLVCGRLCGWTL